MIIDSNRNGLSGLGDPSGCPSLTQGPGACVSSSSLIQGAMAQVGATSFADYLQGQLAAWNDKMPNYVQRMPASQQNLYWAPYSYCDSWQLMQLACLNSIMGGISTDGNGNISYQGMVVYTDGPVGPMPVPDILNPSALNAGVTSQLNLIPGTSISQTQLQQMIDTSVAQATAAGQTNTTNTNTNNTQSTAAGGGASALSSFENVISTIVPSQYLTSAETLATTTVGGIPYWGYALGALAVLWFLKK